MATLASQPDADGVVVRIPLREVKLDLTKKEPSIEGDLREVFGVSDVAFDAGTKSWSLKLSQPDDKNALFPADFSWRLSKDGTALEGRWGNWSREGAKGTPSR
jgi:hypothetical protein